MVVPCFLNILCLRHVSKHEYKLRKTCTVEKETVIIADKQAPVTQKQKATDHIDEELPLAIFRTLKLSQIFFLILLEF